MHEQPARLHIIHTSHCKRPLKTSFLFAQVDGSSMQVALQWCSDSFSDHLVGFVNNVKTIDGGTHMDGLKAALTRTINTLAKCGPADGWPDLCSLQLL